MIEVSVTTEMLQKAKELMNKEKEAVKGTDLKNRFNTDWDLNKTQGYLGELLFEEFLKNKGINYECDFTFGEADLYDFKINNKKIDVKTLLRKMPVKNIKSNYQLMINKRQLSEHPADYYFFVMIEGPDVLHLRKAFLVGFISHTKASSFKTKEDILSEAVWIPLDEVLKPALLEMEI